MQGVESQDVFITQRSHLLANWAEACPHAQVFKEIASANLQKNKIYLFWLHSHYDRHQWLANAMEYIQQHFPESRIVVLANVPEQADAVKVMGQGALGYCHAYSAAEVLLEVKTVITHGGVWLGREFLQQMIKATTSLVKNQAEQVSSTLALLTQREREVAIEAANGFSNKEIARKLNITERTVKAHLSATFERLGVKDRLQLALIIKQN